MSTDTHTTSYVSSNEKIRGKFYKNPKKNVTNFSNRDAAQMQLKQ